MPTKRNTSADRVRMAFAGTRSCARIVSLNCAPMLFIGLSAFMALCITTE